MKSEIKGKQQRERMEGNQGLRPIAEDKSGACPNLDLFKMKIIT
jgi:hypothetical protein